MHSVQCISCWITLWIRVYYKISLCFGDPCRLIAETRLTRPSLMVLESAASATTLRQTSNAPSIRQIIGLVCDKPLIINDIDIWCELAVVLSMVSTMSITIQERVISWVICSGCCRYILIQMFNTCFDNTSNVKKRAYTPTSNYITLCCYMNFPWNVHQEGQICQQLLCLFKEHIC